METNRTKFLTKDYLTEQFYNYNKKYIIDDVKKNKQDNLEITSRHITWEDTHKLGLNISNDKEAKPYDYLILEPWDEDDYYEDEFGDKIYGQGKLRWDSPIDDQSKIEDGSKFLVNGNAIYNWKGSKNITTLGQITQGSWKVGRMELFSEVSDTKDETYQKIGNFKIEFINSDANNLKITGQSDGTYEPTIVIEPKTELNETDIKGKTTISSNAGGTVLTVNGQTEITGKLTGSIAEFSGGITAGEDGDDDVSEGTIQKTDTMSSIKGNLTVSKLVVDKELTVAAPTEFREDVKMDKSLSVGNNFTVSEDGEVRTNRLEASSEITTQVLNVNTIKIIANESDEEDEELDEDKILDNDYSINSIDFESNVSFNAGRLFINSETDIVVVKDGGDDDDSDVEFYQPIKINGKYMQLASDSDVAITSWVADSQS